MLPSRTRPILVLLFVLSSLSLVGCNVVRITLNTPLTPDDVTFIVPGRTTFAEVIDRLGSPDSLNNSSNGIVSVYRFLDMKYARVNLGYLARPWSPVDPDLVFSRTGFGTDAFQVFYDSHGVVVAHSFLRHVTERRFHPYPF
ncbi:MAG TPA: hypothetical protein VJR03_15240 [Nitrospira sp.]|nr:hypothetical protein [Nitrospira sp.]